MAGQDNTEHQLPGEAARAAGAKNLPPEGRTEVQSDSSKKQARKLSQLVPEPTQPQHPAEVIDPSKRRRLPQVPGYELLDMLGHGSYGEVWHAREVRTGIDVAIKFLVHGAGLQWQLLQAEVKQLARLHADPGIVQLIDVEPTATPPYYIMEYLRQGSLARRLEKGPLPVKDALAIFRQMAEALAYVHAKGIRHCDLKPANVLLDARGRARLADFGQAHLSSDASPALGTFFYMSPEQADLTKQIPDTRWDVYALGALFYTMVTGRPPREDPSIRHELAGTEELSHRLARYREWVQKAPEPRAHRNVPGMDRLLADIITRCLAIDPERRFPDAAAILAALDRRLRLRRQRPLLVFGFAGPLLLVLIMAGLGTMLLNTTIDRSESALVGQLEQLLDSDLVLARVVARAVDEEVTLIKRPLEFKARREELRAALRDADRKSLTAVLKDYYETTNPGQLGRWVVTDPRGRLVGCYPVDESIYDMDFAWRGWFNGASDQPKEKGNRFEPLQKTQLSEPFVGQSKGHPLAIAASTPIWEDDEQKSVAGVLMVTVLLNEIHRWLEEKARLKHGFIVLINEDGQFLHHRDGEAIKPIDGKTPRVYHCDVFREVLAGKEGSQSHVDPLDGQTYLTAYAPVPHAGWGVLVQHDREQALLPMTTLKEDLSRFFWFGLIVVGILISALWGALIVTFRRSVGQENSPIAPTESGSRL